MENRQARVLVTLKKNILDPQGTAIKHELQMLGYDGIQDVRIGKLIEVSFAAGVPEAERQRLLAEVSDRLFANPVIEDYRID
jgi:phosphoribosylformylglycinamidine synthase